MPAWTCSPTSRCRESHPLTRLDNVTLTAHAAFMTEEASARLLRMALELLAEERALKRAAPVRRSPLTHP